MECHLRTRVLPLVTEHEALSVALLSFALTSDARVLEVHHDNAHRRAPESATAVANFSRDLALYAPVLAPFEAVYGLAYRVFLGAVREAQVAGAELGPALAASAASPLNPGAMPAAAPSRR